MKQIRKRLTYANVMSSIAVFVVLGGGAIAATQLPKNSVGSKQLKKNAVKTTKIANNAVNGAKIADGSVTGAEIGDGTVTAGKIGDGSVTTGKLADNAVTGAKVDEATLGEVPSAKNASFLGGSAASEYAKAQLPAPTLATLIGTWKTESGRAPASFYKDPFGIVHLEGVVEGGGTFSQIFELPAGYRPEQSANFLIYGNASSAAGLFVSDEGDVTLLNGDDAFISLYGVTFRAGN